MYEYQRCPIFPIISGYPLWLDVRLIPKPSWSRSKWAQNTDGWASRFAVWLFCWLKRAWSQRLDTVDFEIHCVRFFCKIRSVLVGFCGWRGDWHCSNEWCWWGWNIDISLEMKDLKFHQSVKLGLRLKCVLVYLLIIEVINKTCELFPPTIQRI